ncbi:MAG: hypothetical protein Kow0047_13030 [Anaerolineae bacterium]
MAIGKRLGLQVLTGLLWLVTVVVAALEIMVVREIVLRIFALVMDLTVGIRERYGAPYWTGLTLGHFVVLICGLAWVAFTVGTGEYHYRHAGTTRSWRVLGWTIAIEAAIWGLAVLI